LTKERDGLTADLNASNKTYQDLEKQCELGIKSVEFKYKEADIIRMQLKEAGGKFFRVVLNNFYLTFV